MTREFIEKFKEKLGYIKCIDLKKEYINVKRCTLMIEIGGEILEDIILKEKHKNIYIFRRMRSNFRINVQLYIIN